MRDEQRAKVYRFDYKIQLLLLQSQMPLEDCNNLILDAWMLLPEGYDEAPELIDGGTGKVAWGNAKFIKLPVWARKKSDVLHEVAHSMIEHMYIKKQMDVAPHGKEFMAIFMWLLNVFCGIPYLTMQRFADQLSIDYLTPVERKLA